VADIVYFPLDTTFMQAAREAGCKTMGGGGRAVYQAAEAFRVFNSVTADSDRMCRHFARLEDFPLSGLHNITQGRFGSWRWRSALAEAFACRARIWTTIPGHFSEVSDIFRLEPPLIGWGDVGLLCRSRPSKR
jgi:hypothetical protein